MWTHQLFGGSMFGTVKQAKPDSATLKPIAEATPIPYPKPDGVVSFDKASSVFLSNTNHEEDQPDPLAADRSDDPDPRESAALRGTRPALLSGGRLRGGHTPTRRLHADPRFVINAQNCVHCKTCDIKDPAQNIIWVPPEGGRRPELSRTCEPWSGSNSPCFGDSRSEAKSAGARFCGAPGLRRKKITERDKPMESAGRSRPCLLRARS